MQNKTFPCSMCGACCRRIKWVVESMEHFDFPYKWNEKGVCEKLSTENKCMVYDNRPLICNIEAMQPFFDIPEQDFYNINIDACNGIMDEDGLPEEYRITKQKL
jgi:Fe-S-cluster containining protein